MFHGKTIFPETAATMQTFEELAKSRRDWIDSVLKPWCETAERVALVQAEIEWPNIAGQVDSQATLWAWAWGRFPALVHADLPGINETDEVELTLQNGQTITGYPNARETQRGRLVMLQTSGELSEPISIDDIASVSRTSG
jgi:hypothetical protein